ncbi:MAG: hypothetical protein Q4P06_08985 [Actinomycetaceae bacterium]|nr:hypothetical protein [Actinomycetaceae bacterium]
MRLTTTLSLLALTAVGTLTAATTSPANAEPAPDLTNACSEFLTHPQVLETDTHPDGTPIESRPGKVADTPVIFVHGWVSTINHDETRTGYFSHYINKRANDGAGVLLAKDDIHTSMIGLSQAIEGTQTYTFDYSQIASRWVTDPGIGQRLADGITCLANTYQKPVVLVAHSMGGLAVREALSHLDGPASQYVSNVVTIGTPNLGSDSADMIASGMETTASLPLLGLPVKLLLTGMDYCADKMDASNEGCIGVKLVDAFRSSGGMALRRDSQQIQALPGYPQDVEVTAVVGDIQLGGLTLFGATTKPLINLGDVLVMPDSASAGADEVATQTCRYGMVSKRSLDEGVTRLKLLTKGDSVERPATVFTTPCWHEALLREQNTNDTVAKVIKDAVGKSAAEPAGKTAVGKSAAEPEGQDATSTTQETTPTPAPVGGNEPGDE